MNYSLTFPPPENPDRLHFKKTKEKSFFSSDEVQNDKGLLLLTGF